MAVVLSKNYHFEPDSDVGVSRGLETQQETMVLQPYGRMLFMVRTSTCFVTLSPDAQPLSMAMCSTWVEAVYSKS